MAKVQVEAASGGSEVDAMAGGSETRSAGPTAGAAPSTAAGRGAVREIELSAGTIRYRDQGAGPAVVLIHGLLVDGSVWDRVVAPLSASARCIVPDLPLGSHRIPMKSGAELTPAGIARLIAELIERLELEDVTLVGNDTGGALCQLVVINDPERIGRLVLTNCDAFENFPPRQFRALVRGLGLPGMIAGLELGGRLRPMRQASMSMMKLTLERIPDPMVKGWLEGLRDRGVRRDLKTLAGGLPRDHRLSASEQLGNFHRPALIVWGMRDAFFPFADAERLAATLPDARLERIENSRAFVQIDAPDRLAELIAEFARSGAPRND